MKNVPSFCAALVVSVLTLLPSPALAGTYWVSPSGQTAWGGCMSETPLDGAYACSLATANANAMAGDTVYLRGGNYTLASIYDGGINPRQSGSCPAPTCLGGVGATRIEFAAYAGETPVLVQASPSTPMIGLRLNAARWIKVTGITFKNFTYYLAFLYGGASYNEVSHCSFVADPGYEAGAGFIVGGFDAATGWSTHNWIHHNYFSSRRSTDPCGEAVDVIRLGNNLTNPWPADNNNTFEFNYVEYGSHSTLVTNSLKNVIANNTFHNEPWVAGCSKWRTSTSTTPASIGVGSRSFTTQPGVSGYSPGQPISIVASADHALAMSGIVKSYDSPTGALVVDVRHTAGTGTYSSWVLSQGNVPAYEDPQYNGRYGHRNVAVGDENHFVDNLNLIEGNRLGFAGVNPGNAGSGNLDFESPGNIGRYNFVYGGMTSGIYFKWANTSTWGDRTGGVRNYVYNNTVYRNGLGWRVEIYGGNNLAYNGQGIAQNNYSQTINSDNVIKNNLVVGNSQGDICPIGWYNGPNCSAAAYDTVLNNWLTSHGDPRFVNPDLSQPASQNLFPSVHGYALTPLPDLRLREASPAADGAGSLTNARGAGVASTTLVLEDAGYFQDGTRGSDLARGVKFFADWIAVGTPGNIVQIRLINYATRTMTLASPLTWADGAQVWLYRKSDGARVLVGAGPDFGASENGAVAPPANVRIIK